MSLTYITKCDGCKIRLEGWDDNAEGWMYVNTVIGQQRLDFCPDCWKKMADAIQLHQVTQ